MAHVESKNSDDPLLQWVTFRLGEESYGINVIQVQEVLRITEIAPVPGSPDFVTGIINLRGNVVTVINTRKRFNLPDVEPSDSARIVIIESGDDVIGMMVDSVAEVVELRQSQVESSPNVNNKTGEFIDGVVNNNGQLLILINITKLISEHGI